MFVIANATCTPLVQQFTGVFFSPGYATSSGFVQTAQLSGWQTYAQGLGK